MDPEQSKKDPNLVKHPNGSVDDVDAPQRPGVITGLARDLGLGDDFIKDVGKELVKGFVKDKLHLSGNTSNKSKVGRTVETLKGLWWVPAAVYVSVMLAVLLIRFLAKVMGI